MKNVVQWTQEAVVYSWFVVRFAFTGRRKKRRRNLFPSAPTLPPLTASFSITKGVNYSISVTWLMRTHTSWPPLHTLKNIIISDLSLVWPRCILQNVWFVSPAWLGKTPQNLWRTSCGICIGVMYFFCWAHSTKLHYFLDTTTTCLYFLPCYK